MIHPLAPRFLVLYAFVVPALLVHYRGLVRHRFACQLTDHSTIFAPVNALIYAFSAVPNRPCLEVRRFPELHALRENWRTIRDEALQLFDEGYIRAALGYNDVGSDSFFRTGRKRFYLKWYDDALPSARKLRPKTVALVESIPGIRGAMFALLPPGGRLVRHRDPFAGSLRYRLGLVTPNSEDCYISVDGERYFCNDGEDVLFDETFIHYAENKTAGTRIILFCDVERPLTSRVVVAFGRLVASTLVRASRTQNLDGEPVGFLDRLFGYVSRVRLLSKRLEAWNRHVYYAQKYLLLCLLLYWIFA